MVTYYCHCLFSIVYHSASQYWHRKPIITLSQDKAGKLIYFSLFRKLTQVLNNISISVLMSYIWLLGVKPTSISVRTRTTFQKYQPGNVLQYLITWFKKALYLETFCPHMLNYCIFIYLVGPAKSEVLLDGRQVARWGAGDGITFKWCPE